MWLVEMIVSTNHMAGNWVNSVIPCEADLFVIIFHAFESGISSAISSFEWMKNNYITAVDPQHMYSNEATRAN